MNNEYFGVATTPTEDFLAHYGVRGMKWGVRKAIASGNAARLGRQYAKAQKKLAKLEKQAAKTDKYKKRAIRMGVGAAAAGGLAAAGTRGVANAVSGAGRLASGLGIKGARTFGVHTADAIREFGDSTAASSAARKFLTSDAVENLGRSYHGFAGQTVRGAGHSVGKAAGDAANRLKGVSNNTLARIGAGAIGAGLAAGAARNAYKAKTAQKKAAQFRAEMNKAFAGTQYANGGSRSASQKKKRR